MSLKSSTANAQGAGAQISPVKPLAQYGVYYPGTEALGPNEMRVIACGTGMPTVRPKQAAACFLVEFGNGDFFMKKLLTEMWGAVNKRHGTNVKLLAGSVW